MADIIVNGVLILELKAVSRLERSHEQRLVHYLKGELGWKQSVDFDEGLRRTVRWYLG